MREDVLRLLMWMEVVRGRVRCGNALLSSCSIGRQVVGRTR